MEAWVARRVASQLLMVLERIAGRLSDEGAIRMKALGLRSRCRDQVARISKLGGVALMVVFFAGCATVAKDSSDADKRKAVTERALARWALIIRGDAGAAYDEYMSKGSRQVISRDEFVERMKSTQFRLAVVKRDECALESCRVSVLITYDHKLMRGVRNTLRENWIIEDGKVWYVWSQ